MTPDYHLEHVGESEIAARLGVARQTVPQWRWRGQLPDPCCMVSGAPAWTWIAIRAWARDTGRLAP